VCLARLPAIPFLALSAAAAGITLLAVWMALHNRQRSVLLQMVSTAGLTSTGLLGALVAVRGLPAWSWLLCGLLALHAVASILVVRTRLELRVGRRVAGAGPWPAAGSPPAQSSAVFNGALVQKWAWAVLALVAAVAVALGGAGLWGLAAVIGTTAAVNAFEMWRLLRGGALGEPLQRVGFRALGTSLLHSALTVAVLW
jgi:hypothetical protein